MKPFKVFLEQVQISINNLHESSSGDFSERMRQNQEKTKEKQNEIKSDYQKRISSLKKGRNRKPKGSFVVSLVKSGLKAATKTTVKSAAKRVKKR